MFIPLVKGLLLTTAIFFGLLIINNILGREIKGHQDTLRVGNAKGGAPT